jgi:hypothetical protein
MKELGERLKRIWDILIRVLQIIRTDKTHTHSGFIMAHLVMEAEKSHKRQTWKTKETGSPCPKALNLGSCGVTLRWRLEVLRAWD